LPNNYATITFNGVIDVSTPGGGDSTNVDSLEFTVTGKGRPTIVKSN